MFFLLKSVRDKNKEQEFFMIKKLVWLGAIILIVALIYINRGFLYKMFCFYETKKATEKVEKQAQKHIPFIGN